MLYRYDYDVYDRIWNTVDWSDSFSSIATDGTVSLNVFNPPSQVMSTAVTPINASKPLEFDLTSVKPGDEYYFYMYFAELQTLAKDDLREIDIFVSNTHFYGPFTPAPLQTVTVYSTSPQPAAVPMNVSIRMTAKSTLPPILNAVEVYSLIDTSQLETDSKDAQAVNNIKSTYNVSRIWQGDPCAPQNYSWDGLACSFSDSKPPRIISLNLSSSGLSGEISNNISGLVMLQKLDLSNNNLTGTVPDFLSKLSSLSSLNLSGNNLTGTVPADLVKKSKAGSLTLNIEGNHNLCLSSPCTAGGTGGNKKKSSLVIPIVAAVAGVLILIILSLVVVFCLVKKRRPQKALHPSDNIGASNAPVMIPPPVPFTDTRDHEKIESPNQRFTYAEVLQITNNFSRVIGRGGFGTVFHGHLGDVQVAVKMLSPSSSQGYKEFKAEAQILMKVHHRNLTSLIGFCDEGDKMGLIYEFMAQGDLHSHISNKNPQHLTWEDRLQISLDAAQGLEYLHNGCKPPIVHRDIKSTNILLNDKFEAKLADFGLSRACPPDADQTGVMPTMVAGTPGYLDPEYYHTQQLHEKSDVFSFGIVLLEVITSKPVIASSPDRTHLSKWVSQAISAQGDVKAILDPRLRGDYDTNSVWKAVEVAMTCVSHASNQRPTMSQVVIELSQCLNMEKARKNEGFTSGTVDSVEMVSLGIDNAYAPSAR
uniref:Protein kinase domain-containing protein n=1 Tax=Kalanchoe fedtschenkoi TaxID=63787 RepID=A0A7N0UY99_KALFE